MPKKVELLTMPEFTAENFMPMEPQKGPPLPKFLGLFWPWYKVTTPTIYTCPICQMEFATESALAAHIASAHPGEPPVVLYTCSICHAQFNTQAELDAHIATEHPTTPPPTLYTCSTCGAVFFTQDELNAHIATEHPEVPPVPPAGITAQIASAEWATADYPYTDYWGESYTATFYKCGLTIDSEADFSGKIKLACPNFIAPVPLLSAQEYQAMMAEIDNEIATHTGAIQQLWIDRKAIAQRFPAVDGFRIDYRWRSEENWNTDFGGWVNGSVASLEWDVDIVAGQNIFNIAFFKHQGAGMGTPVTINLTKNSTIIDSIESALPGSENAMRITSIIISQALSGEQYTVQLSAIIPLVTEQQIGSIGVEPDIKSAVGYGPHADKISAMFEGSGERSWQETATATWSRSLGEGWPKHGDIPPGTYPVKASGEIWRGEKYSETGWHYYGTEAIAKWNFGVVGQLVVE